VIAGSGVVDFVPTTLSSAVGVFARTTDGFGVGDYGVVASIWTLYNLFNSPLVQGAFYDYQSRPPGEIFWKDFAGTPATALGDPVRVNLDSNSIGKQKTAFLNGTVGTFFSTPDADGLDITGDIDIRCHVALQDWTPGALNTLVGKWTVGQYSFYFGVSTTGGLSFGLSANGSSTAAVASTIATGVADFGSQWVRVTYRTSDRRVQFFLGGANAEPQWTQLGADVTQPQSAIFASTSALEIGSNAGGGGRLTGRIYRAQVYAGLDGTDLRADFDPSQYSSGNTFTSGGAVYTRNGQSFIAGDGTHRVTPSDATRLQLGRFPAGVGVRNAVSVLSDRAMPSVKVGSATLTFNFGIAPEPYSSQTSTRVQSSAEAGDFYSIAGTPGEQITLSFWARLTPAASGGSGNGQARIQLFDLPSATNNAQNFPLTESWQRVQLSRTMGASQTSVQARILAANIANSDIEVWGVQLEKSPSATEYQRVGAGPYDITQSGIPSTTALYRSTTLYSESLLPAITTGSIVLAGDKGIWSDTLTYAGGTFAWGPTTYTGGPTGLYSNIVGLFDVGGVFTTTALSAAQLTQVQRYFVRAGSVGAWEAGAELVVNGGFDADTDWTKGAGWSIGSGVATKTAGAATSLIQNIGGPTSGVIRFQSTMTRSAGSIGYFYQGVFIVSALSVSTTTDSIIAFSGGNGGGNLAPSADASFSGTIDNISLKAITLNTSP
jgi:hypothetical protein